MAACRKREGNVDERSSSLRTYRYSRRRGGTRNERVASVRFFEQRQHILAQELIAEAKTATFAKSINRWAFGKHLVRRWEMTPRTRRSFVQQVTPAGDSTM